MKITASRKDDILKRKAEYDAKMQAYSKEHDRRWRNYRQAQYAVSDPIAAQIQNMLKRFTALQFDVIVDEGRSWGRYKDSVEVKVRCNENNQFDENSALSWSWEAKVNRDGEVEKESSSWSGLKACTAEQLRSLEQTLQALKLLNGIDWNVVLNVDMPDYDDYFRDMPEEPKREDFSEELKEAELEDLIGKNALVEVYNWESSPFRGNSVYLQILKETPSQYVCKIFSGWSDNSVLDSARRSGGYEQRVRKSTIRFTQNPPKILEF